MKAPAHVVVIYDKYGCKLVCFLKCPFCEFVNIHEDKELYCYYLKKNSFVGMYGKN